VGCHRHAGSVHWRNATTFTLYVYREIRFRASFRFDDILHRRFGDRVARYCPDFSLLCLRQSRLSDYGYSRREFVFYLLNGRLHFGVVGIVIGDNSYLAQHGFQLTQIR
jgi:hypothetical protein